MGYQDNPDKEKIIELANGILRSGKQRKQNQTSVGIASLQSSSSSGIKSYDQSLSDSESNTVSSNQTKDKSTDSVKFFLLGVLAMAVVGFCIWRFKRVTITRTKE